MTAAEAPLHLDMDDDHGLEMSEQSMRRRTFAESVRIHVGKDSEDSPEEGVFQISTPDVIVTEASDATGPGEPTGSVVEIYVMRGRGGHLPADVYYETVDGKAKAGKDFEAAQGCLHFGEQEYRKTIFVRVLDNPGFQGDRKFKVILTHVTGGTLGTCTEAKVTILETGKSLPSRLLANPVFAVLTSMATLFALVGNDLALLLLSKDTDLAISIVTGICMIIFIVELICNIIVRRAKYLKTTVFAMDVIAILGMWLYLPAPIAPQLGVGGAEGSLARASRAARAGARMGRNMKLPALMMRAAKAMLHQLRAMQERRHRRYLPRPPEAKGPENVAAAIKGALSSLLPTPSKIGIAVVEFIIGRLILMMLLMLLASMYLTVCTSVTDHLYEAALLLTSRVWAESGPTSPLFAASVNALLRQVGTAHARVLHLRVGGQNVTRPFADELGLKYARNLGYEHEMLRFRVVQYARNLGYEHEPERMLESDAAACTDGLILDVSSEEKANIRSSLYLTAVLVIVLMVGAGLIVSDIQHMLLDPIKKLASVIKALMGGGGKRKGSHWLKPKGKKKKDGAGGEPNRRKKKKGGEDEDDGDVGFRGGDEDEEGGWQGFLKEWGFDEEGDGDEEGGDLANSSDASAVTAAAATGWKQSQMGAGGKGPPPARPSLFAALTARVQRLRSVDDRTVDLLSTSLDNLEKAFGVRLLDIKQWAGSTLRLAGLAATIADSLIDSFWKETLTIGELRSKAHLVSADLRVPKWVVSTQEVHAILRIVRTATAMGAPGRRELQATLEARLAEVGMRVNGINDISVAMLRRLALIGIKHYQLLSWLGEDDSALDTQTTSLADLIRFVEDLIRRRAKASVEASGIKLPDYFMTSPVTQLPSIIASVKVQYYHKQLVDVGLRMPERAACAPRVLSLRAYAEDAFLSRALTFLNYCGADRRLLEQVQDVALRTKAPSLELARMLVTLRACRLPEVNELAGALASPLLARAHAALVEFAEVVDDGASDIAQGMLQGGGLRVNGGGSPHAGRCPLSLVRERVWPLVQLAKDATRQHNVYVPTMAAQMERAVLGGVRQQIERHVVLALARWIAAGKSASAATMPGASPLDARVGPRGLTALGGLLQLASAPEGGHGDVNDDDDAQPPDSPAMFGTPRKEPLLPPMPRMQPQEGSSQKGNRQQGPKGGLSLEEGETGVQARESGLVALFGRGEGTAGQPVSGSSSDSAGSFSSSGTVTLEQLEEGVRRSLEEEVLALLRSHDLLAAEGLALDTAARTAARHLATLVPDLRSLRSGLLASGSPRQLAGLMAPHARSPTCSEPDRQLYLSFLASTDAPASSPHTLRLAVDKLIVIPYVTDALARRQLALPRGLLEVVTDAIEASARETTGGGGGGGSAAASIAAAFMSSGAAGNPTLAGTSGSRNASNATNAGAARGGSRSGGGADRDDSSVSEAARLLASPVGSPMASGTPTVTGGTATGLTLGDTRGELAMESLLASAERLLVAHASSSPQVTRLLAAAAAMAPQGGAASGGGGQDYSGGGGAEDGGRHAGSESKDRDGGKVGELSDVAAASGLLSAPHGVYSASPLERFQLQLLQALLHLIRGSFACVGANVESPLLGLPLLTPPTATPFVHSHKGTIFGAARSENAYAGTGRMVDPAECLSPTVRSHPFLSMGTDAGIATGAPGIKKRVGHPRQGSHDDDGRGMIDGHNDGRGGNRSREALGGHAHGNRSADNDEVEDDVSVDVVMMSWPSPAAPSMSAGSVTDASAGGVPVALASTSAPALTSAGATAPGALLSAGMAPLLAGRARLRVWLPPSIRGGLLSGDPSRGKSRVSLGGTGDGRAGSGDGWGQSSSGEGAYEQEAVGRPAGDRWQLHDGVHGHVPGGGSDTRSPVGKLASAVSQLSRQATGALAHRLSMEGLGGGEGGLLADGEDNRNAFAGSRWTRMEGGFAGSGDDVAGFESSSTITNRCYEDEGVEEGELSAVVARAVRAMVDSAAVAMLGDARDVVEALVDPRSVQDVPQRVAAALRFVEVVAGAPRPAAGWGGDTGIPWLDYSDGGGTSGRHAGVSGHYNGSSRYGRGNASSSSAPGQGRVPSISRCVTQATRQLVHAGDALVGASGVDMAEFFLQTAKSLIHEFERLVSEQLLAAMQREGHPLTQGARRLGSVAELHAHLLERLRKNVQEAYTLYRRAPPPGLSSMDMESLLQLTLQVPLSDVPCLAPVLSVLEKMPSQLTQDEKIRHTLGSAYPAALGSIVPEGAALPSLAEVLEYPQAHLFILATQMLLMVGLVSARRRKPVEFFNAYGERLRWLVKQALHLQYTYQRRDELTAK
eukprot:jgi/Mesvir1/824/Mv17408-RA.1